MLSGCSWLSPTPKTRGAGGVPIEATAGIDPDVTPFVLEVVDEINDGKRLWCASLLWTKEGRSGSPFTT
jgi:hypothetical protein